MFRSGFTIADHYGGIKTAFSTAFLSQVLADCVIVGSHSSEKLIAPPFERIRQSWHQFSACLNSDESTRPTSLALTRAVLEVEKLVNLTMQSRRMLLRLILVLTTHFFSFSSRWFANFAFPFKAHPISTIYLEETGREPLTYKFAGTTSTRTLLRPCLAAKVITFAVLKLNSKRKETKQCGVRDI